MRKGDGWVRLSQTIFSLRASKALTISESLVLTAHLRNAVGTLIPREKCGGTQSIHRVQAICATRSSHFQLSGPLILDFRTLFFTNLPSILFPPWRRLLAGLFYSVHVQKNSRSQSNTATEPNQKQFIFYTCWGHWPYLQLIFLFWNTTYRKVHNTYIYNLVNGCEVYTL